jgi:hypothetical protein
MRGVQPEPSGALGRKVGWETRSLMTGREEVVIAQWRGRRSSGSRSAAREGLVARRPETTDATIREVGSARRGEYGAEEEIGEGAYSGLRGRLHE